MRVTLTAVPVECFQDLAILRRPRMLSAFETWSAHSLICCFFIIRLISAALVLSTFDHSAAPSTASTSMLSVTAAMNTTREYTPSCVLPESAPVAPVSFEVCIHVFEMLLNAPDTDFRKPYERLRNRAIPISGWPCAIELDKESRGGELVITKRQIVGEVTRILRWCQLFGEGGWVQVEQDPQWIVIVSGWADLGGGGDE